MSDSIDRREPAIMDAIDGVVTGRLTREQFVRRATVLGLSASAIAGMLAALGRDAAHAAITKQLAGTTINALIVAEGDDKGVKDHIPLIKKQLGIDLKMTALSVGPLIEKENQNLKAPTSAFDIMQVLGFSVSQMVGGGFFTPLNPFLAKAPAGYDFPRDYPKGQLEYVGYFDVANQRFGGKDLYLVPGLHGGSVILFYRKDLVKKPPRSWDEYLTLAKQLNKDGVAGNSIIGKSGDPSFFLVDWFTRFTTFGGKLMSGSPKAKNLTPRLTSPEAVKALEHMARSVDFASDGVLQYDFTASVDAFSAAKTALMLMWSTIAGPVYNPKSSKVADKVSVAVNPGVGGFAGRAVRGGWGVGIPKNAKNKDAAWAVITYLTSKQWERYQTSHYQTDPSRKSTFNDSKLVRQFPYLPVAGRVYEKAQILDIAIVPETFEMITAASEEFSLALSGSSTVTAALKKAQGRWVDILKRGGHLA